MNRTYKTVWNEQAGTFVAVSENTKARGKRSGSRLAVTRTHAVSHALASLRGFALTTCSAVLCALGLLSSPGLAQADVQVGDGVSAIQASGSTLTFTANPGQILFTSGGTITGLDDGAVADGSKDAVNGGQLYALQSTVSKGWNLKTNGDGGFNVQPDGTVEFINGQNIALTRTNGKVTVATKNDVSFATVAATGNMTVGGGLQVAGPATLNGGLAVGAKKITNMADGTVALGSKDAVTGGQLFTLQDKLFTTGTGIKYFHANSGKADSQATGADAVAIGPEADAGGDAALAAGLTAEAKGKSSIALGQLATAAETADSAIVIGNNASTASANALALGSNASATGASGLALGTGATATTQSVAIGSGAAARDGQSISIGTSAGVNTGPAEPTTDVSNIAIGTNSGNGVVGGFNTGIGNGAGSGVTGAYNTALGNFAGNGLAGDGNISIGKNANQNGGSVEWSVAIGSGTHALGNDSIAMGTDASSSGAGAMALGKASSATGSAALAIGENARSGDGNSVALGSNSQTFAMNAGQLGYLTNSAAPQSSISVGSAAGPNIFQRRISNVSAGSLDYDAVNVSQLKQAQQSVAALVGGGTTVNPDGTFSYHLGDTAYTSINAALIDLSNGGLAPIPPDGNPVVYENGTSNSVVQLAGAGGTVIKNVAAGTGPNDAVNVGQLNTTVQANKTRYVSINSPAGQQNSDNAGATGAGAIAIGSAASGIGDKSTALGSEATAGLSAASTGATAIGYQARVEKAHGIAVGENSRAYEDSSVAIGHDSVSYGKNGVALGTGANIAQGETSGNAADDGVAIGTDAQVTRKKGIAIGAGSVAAADSAMAYGAGSQARGGSSVAIGVGSGSFAANAVALGASAGAYQQDGAAMGTNAKSYAANGLALGTGATAGYVNATPEQLIASVNTTAIGFGADAKARNSMALGTGSNTQTEYGTTLSAYSNVSHDDAASGVISIGNSGGESGAGSVQRRITNVAGGQLDTDAVNVLQLKSVDTLLTARGFALKAQDGSQVLKPLGQAVEVVGGGTTAGTYSSKNTKTAVQGGKVVIQMADTPFFTGADMGGQKITRVAAGTLNAASLDGVNGSQLYATNTSIENLTNVVTANKTHYYSVNDNGVHTAANYNDDGATGVNALAAGVNASAGAAGAVAVGLGSVAGGTNSFAAGTGAHVSGANAIAIGNGAWTRGAAGGYLQGLNGIAMGTRAAAGAEGIAIGTGAINQISVPGGGSVNGYQSIAIGSKAQTGSDQDVALGASTIASGGAGTALAAGVNAHAQGDSVALGADAQAIGSVAGSPATEGSTAVGAKSRANAIQALALGNGAIAGNENAVALGSGSVTAAAVGTAGVTINGKDYDFAGTNPTSVVSMGGGAIGSRQVINVAAGRIGSMSTDAINGSQLFATNSALSDLSTAVDSGATHYYDVNDGGTQGGNYDNDGAMGINSLAAGVGAISNGSDAVAIGHGASAAGAGAMAIGPGAVASNDGAIALGAGSVTAAAVATAGVTINGTDYDFAGTDPASVVSMGGGLVGARQVTNVAAGRISAGSTDAINGSQLFATNLALTSLGDVIENINNGAGIVYFHANGGPSPIMPDSQAAGLGSVAVGPAAVSTGADSVALGNGAGSGGQGSTALGAGAQAMQDGDVALGQGAVADGGAQSYTGKYSGAQNTTAGTVSVGVAGAERTISNVADGKEATDAVNLRQLDGAVQAANDYTDSQISNVVNNVNNGSTGMFQVSQDNNAPPPSPTGANSAAGGTGAVASGANSTAVGNDSVASGTDSTALGNGATASADNSVALGQGSVADRANSVSVGAAGSERQITHVAAGVLSATSTDAVNGSQLYGTNQTVNNIVNGKAGLVQQVTNNAPVTIAKDSGGTVVNVSGQDGDRIISGVADGQAPNDAATVGQLNQLGQGTGQQINRLDDRIDKAENRSNAGIAAALATAGLPQAYLPGKSMFSVGGGTWNGETGYAMGLSTVSDNGKWLVKGTASTSSRGDVGGSVGVGYQW